MGQANLACDFVPSGFFALRTPLLPFDELLAWGDGLEAAAAGNDAARLEAAVAADRARLRRGLCAAFARPEVREALFVASPDLEERLDLWLQTPDCEPGRKVERALVRYFARMAGRATPFGLFAGCSVGTAGADTRLTLAGRTDYRRHTRLDMDYLVLLTDDLAREPALRPALSFGVNSSLYPARGRLRYCEVRRNGQGWTHHQVALEVTDYLEATLARSGRGATWETLVSALLDGDPEASRHDADDYVGELIAQQVLVSELRPAVTGPEPIRGLGALLRQRGAPECADRLEQACRELDDLDAGGLGAEPTRYRRVAGLLERLPGEANIGRLFQVDMVKPVATASVGPAVLDEIIRGVALLHRLARRPRNDPLSRFRDAFLARYEGREVPLVEALDEDTGVGFETLAGGSTDTSSLLDGLTFPKAEDQTTTWGRREAWLLRHVVGQNVIELTSSDLEELAEPSPPPLPDAFAVMATVAAPSEQSIADGKFQVLLGGLSGPSGARLLGRFCHADADLHQAVEQHVRAEEGLQADAIFAEVIHLPEGRLGNILARPVLRAYEIPYLGPAGVPADRAIPVTDLYVSVAGQRIVLRSARLGRRVLPRLTSAHNFHQSQGIYRFLCALQSQGTAGELCWDWGPLRDAPFLPRVTCGRLVLARAVWQVSRDELRSMGCGDNGARFHAVQRWRAARRLPRWVLLAEGDNELPIDLENVLMVETLLELVKNHDLFSLVELFPGPDALCARGPEGRFVHELIVPFVRKDEGERRYEPAGLGPGPHHSAVGARASARRTFPLGSEWLYVKAYAGPAALDRVLQEVVRPVVEAARCSGAADRWFFIRYGDPDWHLRLRFHGRPARLHGEVLPALQAAATPLLDDGRLWRLQVDTYEREVERYGGPEGIELAERMFELDSDLALALAGLLAEDARGDLRWRWAVAGMDGLLADFGLDLGTRRAIVQQTREQFAAEFQLQGALRSQLGTRFRQERQGLERLLADGPEADPGLAAGHEALRHRSHEMAPVVRELQAQAASGRLTRPLTELASSYLHMHANRLLRSAHRAQELVLYDFLSRLYESQLQRSAAAREALPPTTPGSHSSMLNRKRGRP
jgi:thiopeptide-type bacteriocin biosynthesis protein